MSGINFRQINRRLAAIFSGAVLATAQVESGYGQDEASVEKVAPQAIASDLFQFPPKSPASLMEAARVTLKLDRVADSRAFLRQIIDSQLSEADLRSLRSDLGPAPFLELRRDVRLQPEAKLLLDAVNAAVEGNTRTNEELRQFVRDLENPGSVGQHAASELMASGDKAIPFLLAVETGTASGKVAARILESQARPLRHGLMTHLEKADPSTRVRVLNLLSGTADSDIAIRLLRWQFDPQGDQSVSFAARKAVAQLSEPKLDAATAKEAVDIVRTEASRLITASGARFSSLDQPDYLRAFTKKDLRANALADAKLLVADALLMQPDDSKSKLLSLVLECAATKSMIGAEPSAAANKSPDALVSGLSTALDLQNPIAATELLRGLRSAKQVEINQTEAAQVLRRATQAPDARVRLLSSLVMRHQFPVGTSTMAISQSVASAKNGSVKPEVVIVSGDEVQSGDMRFILEQAGYAAQTAETGPAGIDLAFAQMNCELFIVHAEATRWPLATTLANLRSDVRTRNTPVVVIGPSRLEQTAVALSKLHPGVWFIPEPVGNKSLLGKLEMLNMPANVLSPEDRTAIKTLLD